MEKTPLTTGQILEILQKVLHDESFRGKKGTRFTITRIDFSEITGMRRPSESFLRTLSDECLNAGMLFVDLGDRFLVDALDKQKNTRKITKELLKKYKSLCSG